MRATQFEIEYSTQDRVPLDAQSLHHVFMDRKARYYDQFQVRVGKLSAGSLVENLDQKSKLELRLYVYAAYDKQKKRFVTDINEIHTSNPHLEFFNYGPIYYEPFHPKETREQFTLRNLYYLKSRVQEQGISFDDIPIFLHLVRAEYQETNLPIKTEILTNQVTIASDRTSIGSIAREGGIKIFKLRSNHETHVEIALFLSRDEKNKTIAEDYFHQDPISSSSVVPVTFRAWGERNEGRNYNDPNGPIFHESFVENHTPRTPKKLRVVSYNIYYSLQMDEIVHSFKNDPILKQADLIFLQEVDGIPGTAQNAARLLAKDLKMEYAYAPAVVHRRTNRNFGNAVLSPWPLRDVKKVILPHHTFRSEDIRIALGATITLGQTDIRLYTLHLDAFFSDSYLGYIPRMFLSLLGLQPERKRSDQFQAVLESAEESQVEHVIIAGDFNSGARHSVPVMTEVAKSYHYSHLTPDIGATIYPRVLRLRLDHIYSRGFETLESGKLDIRNREGKKMSNHLPIWADLTVQSQKEKSFRAAGSNL